jgi:nucleotide-binding universal stress UspA family protein
MYQQIVVGTDGSAGADIAVNHAFELARLTGATLHVVNAHKLTSAFHLSAAAEVGVIPDVTAADEALVAQSRSICSAVVGRAGAVGVAVETHTIAGDPADALIRVAADANADVIVVGNRGMTGARRILGSVPNRVAHHCSSSVLIVDTSAADA